MDGGIRVPGDALCWATGAFGVGRPGWVCQLCLTYFVVWGKVIPPSSQDFHLPEVAEAPHGSRGDT